MAEYTLCLILLDTDIDLPHWRTEIRAWLLKLRSSNRIKTKNKKISLNDISRILYARPFDGRECISSAIRNMLSIHKYNDVAPNKIDISNYNLDFVMISLGAIYDDYIKFIIGDMDLDELKSRMENYYLYEE